ncbi:MAG: hypothetical protein GXP29_01205 [Planctomycetes bacterium]|nr:hypothetical protein [Planctomycetota bacterium]
MRQTQQRQFRLRAMAGTGIVLCCLLSSTEVLAQSRDAASQSPAEKAMEIAGLSAQEALARAIVLIKTLEDAEVDPDEMQRDQADYIEATALVERALSLDPISKTAGYLNGRLGILAGRPRSALPMIEEYATDPAGQNDWLAFKILGELYASSFPKLAVSKYRRAIELAENEPEPVIGLARAQLKLNRPELAVEEAQNAIRLDKDNDSSYRATLAEAFLLDKKIEDAAAAAETAVRMAEEEISRDPSRRSLLAELESHYDLHLRCVSELVALYPERAEYVVQLSRIWQDKADLERVVSYHEAVIMIERARANPELKPSSELLYEQARLNRLVSRDDKAVIVLRELLAADPGFQPAIELMGIIGAPTNTEGAKADDKGSEASAAVDKMP